MKYAMMFCIYPLSILLGILLNNEHLSAQQPPKTWNYDKELLKTLKKPTTVEHYFLLLPEALFQYTEKTRPFDTKTRRTVLTITEPDSAQLLKVDFVTGLLDVKNKFLIVNTPNDEQGTSFSVALWTRKDKSVLVGLSKRSWSGTGKTADARFFVFEKEQWREVTDEVLPRITLADFLTWREVQKKPQLQPPLDIELARNEQATLLHLDIQSVKKLPEIAPILFNFDRYLQFKTLELRLQDSVFRVTNRY